MVNSYQLSVPQASDPAEHSQVLVQTVERALDTGLMPGGQYTALLVDEAHDFEDAWLRMAGPLVNPATNSLLVLYDDAQSIYQKKRRTFNFASVGIEARGRTSILRLNYRNTAEVLALAVHCAHSLLEGAGDGRGEDEIPLVQPASAGRRGAMPVLLQGRDEREEAELIAERVAAAHAAGMPLEDIGVLCRAKYLMRPIEQALGRRKLPVQSMNAQAFRIIAPSPRRGPAPEFLNPGPVPKSGARVDCYCWIPASAGITKRQSQSDLTIGSKRLPSRATRALLDAMLGGMMEI